MADAEQFLNDVIVQISAEQEYENAETTVAKVSTEGANFTSFLYEVTISAEGKDDLKLFAKVAAVGEALRSQSPVKLFEVETYFYQKILKKYQKLEEDSDVDENSRLVVPKLYGLHPTEYEEVVVFEDLKRKGYTSLDRFEIFSWEYLSAAIKELAKLHSLSFAYAKADPEGFASDLEKLKPALMLDSEQMKEYFTMTISKATALVTEENQPRFIQYISTVFTPETIARLSFPEKHVILKHGDYRSSNLMHKTNEDGSISVIPLDFQTIQPGDPAYDLLYLVVTGTDEEFRAKHWQELLDLYYNELCASMNRLGVDPEDAYSREAFDENVKESMPSALIIALSILPIVTAEDPAELSENLDVATLLEMKPGVDYQQRLNGIVNDFIKWEIM